jgi:rRNA maturation RNase YbeY
LILREQITKLFKTHHIEEYELTFIFCTDDYLLGINRQHLKHDYYTDIITFDLSTDDQVRQAEIYISVDRVKDNSRALKNTFPEEMYRVIFHGVLHLCGYKDKSPSDIKKMRAAEEKVLTDLQVVVSRNTVSK